MRGSEQSRGRLQSRHSEVQVNKHGRALSAQRDLSRVPGHLQRSLAPERPPGVGMRQNLSATSVLSLSSITVHARSFHSASSIFQVHPLFPPMIPPQFLAVVITCLGSSCRLLCQGPQDHPIQWFSVRSCRDSA